MKKAVFLNLLWLISVLSIECKKDADSIEYTSKPVVEAYLMAGKNIKVQVTKEALYSSSSDTIEPIDSLEIKIIYNTNQYFLTWQGDGIYTSDTDLIVQEGGAYYMEFVYNNKIVSASTTIPEKPTGFTSSASSLVIETFDPLSGSKPDFPDPVDLSWDNPDNDYFLVVVKNVESTLVPINEKMEDDTLDDKRPVFRNEPSQSSEYELQTMNFTYYGTHHILLYKLNTEYSMLYEDNGNNSQNLTTPISNIENGLGIFTGINADSLTIDVSG